MGTERIVLGWHGRGYCRLLLVATFPLVLVVFLTLLGFSPPGQAASIPPTEPAEWQAEAPVFTYTVSVVPDTTTVRVRESLVVTVSLSTSSGCQFPVYELSLRQDVPSFDYVQPITHTVGPGVGMPYTYTLLAQQPGNVTLTATLSGERYCGDFWHWRYLTASSVPITIEADPYIVYLPVLGRH